MSIFEYDEEKHLRNEREIGYKNGCEEGRKEGEARVLKLIELLMDAERDGDVKKALSDVGYREQLYKEYQL